MNNGFITVREFIEMLKEFPPDTPMVLSSDEEGNNIRRVNGVGERYVESLQYAYMDSLDAEELEEYDSWVLTTEVW